MNTKIREWEAREAGATDKYLQEKYGKTLDELYPCPDAYLILATFIDYANKPYI